MSYCRFSGKIRVHMVDTGNTVFCAGCWLVPDDVVEKSYTFSDKKDALMHLIDHKRAGHNPPKYAFMQLMNEILAESRLTNVGADKQEVYSTTGR